MPPFLPRKRLASTPPRSSQTTPKKPRLADALDAEPTTVPSLQKSKQSTLGESDSDSSLSDVDSDEFDDVPSTGKAVEPPKHEEDDDEDDIEWEDAAPDTPSEKHTHTPVVGDIQLTFRKNEDGVDYGTSAAASKGKKGPSKREKQVRIQTHCLHVQFLLYHNAIRNRWICDKTVQETLVKQLPPQIKKEVEKWRAASGLLPEQSGAKKPASIPRNKRRGKQEEKKDRSERDWGNPSLRMEPGKPDLSHGDPLIHLMKVLSAYWKKRFAITAPGLRKRGYGTKLALKQEITSLRNDEHDPELHGERIRDLKEFRKMAENCEGSRDVGAQLFTALLRGLGIDSRLVASLQPSGYGWTKAEQMLPKKLGRKNVAELSSESSDEEEEDGPAKTKIKAKSKAKAKAVKASSSKMTKGHGSKTAPIGLDSDAKDSDVADDNSVIDVTPSLPKQKAAKYDRDLAFPVYWTEAISAICYSVLPVSPLVLALPVASTPEVLSAFEPRGAKAEKGKQVMAYVVAYSSDGSAKDVTVRYLRKKIWPGKTKGFRMPLEKIPIYNKDGKVKRYEEYDWFKHIMSGYARTDAMRTHVDDVEDSGDLVPAEPEKKDAKEEGDTLQSLKSSADFVLERFLRREEALRPGAKPDRTFVSGKGDHLKSEPVYRRSDVERCLTAESWHKEGRQPKTGENPMKLVPVRAVTLTRKREAEDHLRQTGEKQMQGLYSWDQTEYIIPPPIVDGVIPKNSYGNMDCFVPSMIPKGAVHVPLRGTVRICKKLEIDYAEAVTGFEFGNKRAVPVCTGVVIAKENEKALREAWEEYAEQQRIKEEGKLEKLCLDMWRKMIMGLRINERVNEDYADDGEEVEEQGPAGTVDEPIDIDAEQAHGFANDREDEEKGGGFLLPHEDDELSGGDLVMERHDTEPGKAMKRNGKVNSALQYPTPSSMPPSKSTSRATRRPLLHADLESTELSNSSSSVATDNDEDQEPHSENGDGDNPPANPRVVPQARIRKRGVMRQMDGSVSSDDGERATTQLSNDNSDSSDEETSNQSDESLATDSDEEEYTPKSRKRGRGKRGRSSQINPRAARKPLSTRPGRGRGRPPKATPTGQTTPPKPRVLRRDGTVVTSPYFDERQTQTQARDTRRD